MFIRTYAKIFTPGLCLLKIELLYHTADLTSEVHASVCSVLVVAVQRYDSSSSKFDLQLMTQRIKPYKEELCKMKFVTDAIIEKARLLEWMC